MRKKSKIRCHPRAFTMIELLIVIGVILLLIKVMMPRFTSSYQKARQAEVGLTLSSIYAAEQQYYLEHGKYTSDLSATGWKPRGWTSENKQSKLFYTYGCFTSSARKDVNFFTGTSQTPGSALGNCFATHDTFTIRAAAKQKDSIDLWEINETGEITHTLPKKHT